MIAPTPDEVRHLIRRGMDTVEIAALFNERRLFGANQNRAWREADVWNLLAQEEAWPAPHPLREIWALGLRDRGARP